MNTLFDKLNLRPQERRLVMVAGVVLFVVLNVWLVIPHFNEWKSVNAKLKVARETAEKYAAESGKTQHYEAELGKLQEEASLFIVPDDQSLSLVQTIQTEAASANVFVQRLSPAGGGAIPNNPFFEEQRVTLSTVAGEPELVNFLKRLGTGTSLIRVRDLDLKPDPSGMKLSASLTIVGNYPKKPGAKTAAPASSGQPAFRPPPSTPRKS